MAEKGKIFLRNFVILVFLDISYYAFETKMR